MEGSLAFVLWMLGLLDLRPVQRLEIDAMRDCAVCSCCDGAVWGRA